MRGHHVLVAMLAATGCANEKAAGGAPRALIEAEPRGAAGGGACTDPAEFGALPGDGVDDRPLLQAYLDSRPAEECVSLCFRPGTYQISRTGGTTHRRIAGLSLERSCLTLSGAGQGTVLMGSGDGGGRSADFSVLSIKAPSGSAEPIRGVTIANLRVSGADTYNTGEQTHVIEVGGRIGGGAGVEKVQLQHLWLDLPPRQREGQDAGPGAWELRGDCVRLIGSPGAPTRQIQIQDSVFSDCDRSSIGIQRHTYDALVTGNLFLDVGDTHIDEEPTGSGPIARTIIANNLFRSERPGSFSITVTGNDSADTASELVLTGNVIDGRGIMLDHVRRATISNNTISAVLAASYGKQGLVEAIKTQDRVLLSANVLRRGAGSPAGAVIRVTYHAGVLPGPISIVGNIVDQETCANAIDLDSVQGAFVSGNDIHHVAEAPLFAAVIARGTAAPVNGLVVSGNRVTGVVGSLFRVQPSGKPVGYANFVGNSSWGARVGVRCDKGTYEQPLVASANLIGGGAATFGCAALRTQMP
jgi:hypothetical protein